MLRKCTRNGVLMVAGRHFVRDHTHKPTAHAREAELEEQKNVKVALMNNH